MSDLPIKTILVLERKEFNLQFALPIHKVFGFKSIEEYDPQRAFKVVAHYTMIGNTTKPDVNVYEFQGIEIK